MTLPVGENTRLMVFDEIVAGEELPTIEYQYDENIQGRYLIATEEENPWYFSASPWGDPILYHCLIDDSTFSAVKQKYKLPFGYLHARQEIEFINPVPLGKLVWAYSKIAEKYVKRGKGYIVIETLLVDDDGIEIMRTKSHCMVDDERIREASKTGLEMTPPPASRKYPKKK